MGKNYHSSATPPNARTCSPGPREMNRVTAFRDSNLTIRLPAESAHWNTPGPRSAASR